MPNDNSKELHDHNTLSFPPDFLWGTATSAYQVEGNNQFSDWWDWELKHQPPQLRSGKACDQYNLFAQDFQMAKSLNQNAHRLSIEWSRIEPADGQFDQTQIDHYKQVLLSLKNLNFKVMLTLWHFTLPKWVADKGGWENSKTIYYFERFIKKVVPEIKDYVDFWITINEPTVYVYMSYSTNLWPSSKKSFFGQMRTYFNLVSAHKKAFRALRKLTPATPVGIANNVQSFESYHKHSLTEQLGVMVGDIFSNHIFYGLTKGYHDFLGVNYYFHHRVRRSKGLIPKVVDVREYRKDVSDLGWEVYPEGIFEVLTDLADHIPIYITELGIASTNDDRRTRFLIQYLHEVYRAILAGVNVRGIFYWSLLDNFEWQEGFTPRFGLVSVDYMTQKRTPRSSAYVYSEINKYNGIPHPLLRLLGHTVEVEEVLCYKHDGPKALCEHFIAGL